jgi:8-oxo-dGTP diphosphatase
MPNPFSVAGLLILGGRVLSVSRKDNQADLSLPGGKVEPEESPEDALVREIKEETGLEVLSLQPVFEGPDEVKGREPLPCRTYRVLAWRGKAKSLEGAVVQWVPPERLLEPNCSFREDNRALFQSLERDRLR